MTSNVQQYVPVKRTGIEISPKISGDSLAFPTGRTASLVVAANDSTDLEKAQADYTCNGTADDVQIQAAIDALSSGGEVFLLEGTYNIESSINIIDDITLTGTGMGSILQLESGNTRIILIDDKINITIRSLYFLGNNPSIVYTTQSIGTESGIDIDSGGTYLTSNINIQYCVFKGFDKWGIHVAYTSANAASKYKRAYSILNCVSLNCYTGCNLAIRSEYGYVNDFAATDCGRGLHLSSGNCVLTELSINNNYFGFYQDDLGNGGHGTVSNSTFNHNTASVYIESVGNGFVFTGCQFFDGNFYVLTSTGIIFDACEIAPAQLTLTTNVANIISNSLILNSYSVRSAMVISADDTTIWRNNVWDDNSLTLANWKLINNSPQFQTIIDTDGTPVTDALLKNINGIVSLRNYADSADLELGVLDLILTETSTPSSVADHGKIYTKTDNNVYFQDGAGNEHTIVLTDTNYGEAFIYGNTSPQTIGTADKKNGLYLDVETGEVSNWTFVVGATDAIQSYASGTGGASYTRVNSTGHTLSNGNIITIGGSSVAGQNGVFTVSDSNTDYFDIDFAWDSDGGASNWILPATLIAGAGAAGKYTMSWQMSTGCAGAQKLTWSVYINTTEQTRTVALREYPINDVGSCSSSAILTITNSDVVWLALESDGTSNVINYGGNFNLHRL